MKRRELSEFSENTLKVLVKRLGRTEMSILDEAVQIMYQTYSDILYKKEREESAGVLSKSK